MSEKPVFFYIRALLSLAGLLGFMYLYGRAMVEVVRAAGTAPVYSDAFLYVATALAGLVGGVAAASLGQGYGARFSLRRRLTTLGRWLAPFQTEDLQNGLAVAYTVIYILYGFAAIIVWVSASEITTGVELVRDLALIFIGLLLATAQSFLGSYTNPSTPTHPPEVPARAGAKRPGKARRHK